jgi:hypothetical protein
MSSQRFEISFNHWWRAIEADGRLKMRPPAPSIQVISQHAFDIAQIVPRANPAIEVAATFASDVASEVRSNSGIAAQACLAGLEFDDEAYAQGIVAEVIEELSVSFVILHELFHILAGHLREHVDFPAGNDPAAAFDEATLGVASTSRPIAFDETERELLRAYYREFEADNCALQAIVQLPMQAALRNVVELIEDDEPTAEAVLSLANIPRLIAFRLVGSAAWLVIKLIESKRSHDLRRRLDGHPLPAARLLASFITLLEEYVGLSRVAADENGRRQHQSTPTERKLLLDFLSEGLKPLLVHLPPITTGGDASDTLPMPSIAGEIAALMFGGEVATAAGREVVRVQSLRPEMESRLASRRYY